MNSKPDTSQTYFFISDAHLGEHLRDREIIKEQRLFSFFDHVKKQNGKLVICGDLFDFWFEYRQTIPKRHFKVLHKLASLTSANIEVHYLAGNHDFYLTGFFEKELGIHIHPLDYAANVEGKKLYVTHGDGLMKSDVGYRFVKKIMRHPVNIFLFKLLHPDVGIPLALLTSHRSRVAASEKKKYSDLDYRSFAEKKISQGFDFVVLGHTHVPALQKFAKGWYINPGDWMFKFTYATITNSIPRLLTWDGLTAKTYTLY